MRIAPLALLSALLLAACEKQAKLPCAGTDTQSDPQNCGGCGIVCPVSLHAAAACAQGACGEPTCEEGWLDLDAAVPGCETESGAIPASGFVLATPSSSTSLIQHVQSGPAHRNEGVLGEPTPAPIDGATEQTDGTHRNLTGVNAFLEEP